MLFCVCFSILFVTNTKVTSRSLSPSMSSLVSFLFNLRPSLIPFPSPAAGWVIVIHVVELPLSFAILHFTCLKDVRDVGVARREHRDFITD